MADPEHVTNSADIPESSNHREEKRRSSASELLEEKAETLPSSTQNIPETTTSVSQTPAVRQHTPVKVEPEVPQTPAVRERIPVEVEPEVPQHPAVEIAPVPVPAIPEVAPVKTVPAEPELPPVETVPAPVEFSSPSGKSVMRHGSCAVHAKRKLDSVSRSNSFAAPPPALPDTSSPCKRVSLLAPPPVDFLVTRRESSESWNKFLLDLNNILESRAEFV